MLKNNLQMNNKIKSSANLFDLIDNVKEEKQ